MNRKIAILSDIHGNFNALKAVISDAEKQEVHEYWVLGDILLPGPGSKDLLELLYQLPITVKIKGNWDDCFLEVLDVSNIDDATDIYLARLSQYLCETLSKDDIEFLRNMPTRVKNTINGVNFSLTHNQIEKNWGGALIPSSEQINFDHLFDKDTDVAIYGHVHHQMMRYDTNDRIIINPGTVGQPFSLWNKFRADNRAQYAILEVDDSGKLDVNFKKVTYDTLCEIELAQQKSLPYFELYKELIEKGINHTHDIELLQSINQKNNYENDVKHFLEQLKICKSL